MTSVTYAIVFSGDIVEGFQLISVKAHMAKLLKADAAKMQTLFSGKPVVMKRTADKAEAAKYGTALKKVGADVKVRIIKPTEPAQQTASPQASAPQSVQQSAQQAAPLAKAPQAKAPQAKRDQSSSQSASQKSDSATDAVTDVNFSLKENDGNLFDAAPEAPTVELDLSAFALAENDGSPIIAPSEEVERLELDLSALSVAENDDTPLSVPEPDVEKVQAPDFGLDELGAVLETIKESIDPVDPDTSGMSLAFPGTDLLNDDEKDPGPAPVSPDTSKINLVPNFD